MERTVERYNGYQDVTVATLNPTKDNLPFRHPKAQTSLLSFSITEEIML